jgi:hypothetical protein
MLSETNACRRVVQTIPPHMSCDVEEFLMARTQPKMKMSVENVLRYINPQNCLINPNTEVSVI